MKKELKSKFASELTTSSGKRVEIDYPNGPIPKFAALYGLDDLFDNLPQNLEHFLFNNKSGDNISLVVPPSIGRFKNLQALMMTNCVSELPEEIGLLKELTYLALPDNKNLKSLPKSILGLPNLRFIMLNGTHPSFPEGFSNMYAEPDKGLRFFARIG